METPETNVKERIKTFWLGGGLFKPGIPPPCIRPWCARVTFRRPSLLFERLPRTDLLFVNILPTFRFVGLTNDGCSYEEVRAGGHE